MIVAIKEPKLIINPSAVSTGKRLLLSVRFWKYAHTHHLTFNRIATVTNFTVLIIIAYLKSNKILNFNCFCYNFSEVIVMNKYVGLLDKIRVIKSQPLLVRFTLQTIHESINCVVADIEIIDKLLIMDDGKYNIAVTGHFNKRNQLVIESMQIRNPDHFTRSMGI